MARRTYGTGSLWLEDGKYKARWMHDGRQVKRTLGPARTRHRADGLTQAQAEHELRTKMAEHASATPQKPTGRTIQSVADEYLAVRRLKTSTAQDYRMHLRVHLAPWFGDTPIERIDAKQITGLRDHLLTQKSSRTGRTLNAKTVRSYLTTLSSLLNYAERKGWIDRSPMPQVDLPAVDEQTEEQLRFLRVFEVHDLAASAQPGFRQDLDRALYLVAALTGMRQGELFGLVWGRVDFERHRVHVVNNIVRGEKTSPKSRKVRSVPLAPQAREALETLHKASHWPDDAHPVFADPLTGRPISRTQMITRYRKSLVAAGLSPAFRFHDLRHTMGTTLAAAGEPVTTIQAYMGHADLETTQRYMHFAPAVDEAERIGRAFAVADPRQADSLSSTRSRKLANTTISAASVGSSN